MPVCWRALNETDAAVCVGLTYEPAAKQPPEVAPVQRKDKLTYQFMGGGSFVDVITRLEPVTLKVKGQKSPALIKTHNATLLAMFARVMDEGQDECPCTDISLHTAFKLRAYGAEERVFQL